MKPTMTIVIPVYNRAAPVSDTLASIAAQSYRPLGVVLVDNNSTDGTLDILKKWQAENRADDFHIEVISECTPGACAARNTGLRKVETDWTMFFDSDDIMLPHHVAKVMDVISRYPDTDIVGGSFMLSYRDGRQRTVRFINRDTIYNNIHHSIFSTLLYCARTDMFRKAGAWDESLSMGDDVELGSRILDLKPKIRTLKGKPTIVVNESEHSISNSNGRTFALVKALRKIQNRLPAGYRHWVDLQIIIQLAAFDRHSPEARKLAMEIIDTTTCLRRRILWRLLYRYTLAGRRGAARIYRLLSHMGF